MSDLEARIVGVEMWIKGHETLCAERYRNLDAGIGKVGEAIAGQRRVMLGIAGSVALIAVSMIAWLAVKVWDAQDQRVQYIEKRVP